MAGQLQSDALKKRKNKEVNYALQFAALSVFILCKPFENLKNINSPA